MKTTTGMKHMKLNDEITRCPYCGSTNVYAGPFEYYCMDCDESWPHWPEPDEVEDFVLAAKSREIGKKSSLAWLFATGGKVIRMLVRSGKVFPF